MIKQLEFKILWENIYLPSMRSLYSKSLFKNVFDQNFFICQLIFKILAAYFATTRCLNVPRKYFFYIRTVVKYL